MKNWKTWSAWKKWLFAICAVLVFIRIGYIVIRGDLNKHYVITNDVDVTNAEEVSCATIVQPFSIDQDNLNKLEIILTGIADDKQGAITIQLFKSEELLYQTNVSLANINNSEWKQVYVNLPVKAGQEYILKMSSAESCTAIPNVLMVNGNLVVRYGYLAAPGRRDKAVNSSLWILLLLALYILMCEFDSIMLRFNHLAKDIEKYMPMNIFLTITEVLLCMAVIGGSGIEFQSPTKVLLYTISIFSAYRLKDRNITVHKIFKKPSHKIWLYILYIYCAFSLVGQRLLIYPLNLTITIAKVFVFIITAIWSVPIVNSFIWLIDSGGKKLISERTQNANDKKRLILFMALIAALLVTPAAYNLFANNPGISSPDTVSSMLSNAKHLHGMRDWHPAFYCMVLRAIITVWDSTYAVILVQYFFWVYVMVEFLLYVRSKGIKDGVIVGVAAFSGFNAGNFIHLNTIWKDIPYTLSIFWALVILSKLLIDQEIYRSKWYIYLEMIVSLVGVFFYRKNGVVSFVVMAIFMIFALRKNKKMWTALGITIAIIVYIKGPVYNYYEIEDTGRTGMYIGLSQDILGVYYNNGEISEDTLKMINVMTAYNNAEYSYTPTWSEQSYGLEVEPSLFIKCYIDTFLRNPIIMSRAMIDREDAVWDVFAGQDSVLGCVNFTETMDANEAWAENYPKRIYRSLYDQMSAETAYTASNQWIAAIEWRCGLFTLLGFMAIVVLFAKNGFKKNVLLIAPIIGHILSLLLSTGWSDFRYFWPLNLMNICIILYTIILQRNEKRKV